MSDLERLAFTTDPRTAISTLRALAEDVSAPRARRRAATRLLGVTLGATGRYALAIDVLTPLVGESTDREASLASSTIGSLHRQLARYAGARDHDTRALVLAGAAPKTAPDAGPDVDPEAVAEALLGLAADAVGDGDADQAAEQLARAVAALPGVGWRPAVRASWVGTEVALLCGDLPAAGEHAGQAVDGAVAAGAARHEAKGLLFRAVTRSMTGDRYGALADAERALALAQRLGALPLVWPAALVLTGLADLVPADRAELSRAAGARAVAAIAAGLPPGWADPWLSGADLRPLVDR